MKSKPYIDWAKNEWKLLATNFVRYGSRDNINIESPLDQMTL